MREVLNRLPKKRGRMKRVLSMVLVFAMILTLGQALPESAMTVKAAGMSVTLHVYNGADGGLDYDAVYMQCWNNNGSEPSVTINATKEYFSSWNANRYQLTSEGNDWYTLTIDGSVEGLQFLNTDGSGYTGDKYDSNMAAYSGDLYFKNGAWYKDSVCTQRLTTFTSEPPFLLVGDLPGIAWDQTIRCTPLPSTITIQIIRDRRYPPQTCGFGKMVVQEVIWAMDSLEPLMIQIIMLHG